MAAESSAPVAAAAPAAPAPDSPQVAAIKSKQQQLQEKLRFLDTQKTSADHDIEAAKKRVQNQLLELAQALKEAK